VTPPRLAGWRRPGGAPDPVRSAHTKAAISTGHRAQVLLVEQLRQALPAGAYGGPAEIVTEFAFHHGRKWRFDVALPGPRVAIEIEGGTHSAGAHVRGVHFAGDCEKYAHAILDGWRVFRVPSDWIWKGRAAAYVLALLAPGKVPAPAPLPKRRTRRMVSKRAGRSTKATGSPIG